VGRLHSRETAAKMGESPTGNARAVGYQYEPIVRMTNTYIDRGDTSFEVMIRDIDLGLYALDMVGGQTAMEMFTFSAAYGYMIRNGEIAELVRDVVLTGNVFETMMHIDLVGDTLVFPPAGGGCGKGGRQKSLASLWDDIKKTLIFIKQSERIKKLISNLSSKSNIEVSLNIV